MALDEELPPFSIPEFDESSNSNSNSNSNSTSAYSEPNLPSILNNAEKLSTEEVIKLAAEMFILFSTERVDGYTMFMHPYGSSTVTRLSIDEIREVELVFWLLIAAEKISRKQFEIGSKFLARCGWVASDGRTPVERLVYYFCEALKKRIGKETGIPVPTKLEKLEGLKNENPMALGTNPTFLECHQALPFSQVLQFCGIQAIIDQIGISSKVHLIDIHIRSGVQWTSMMQALVGRTPSIKLLKLTAVATPLDVQNVEKTGKRLASFAKTLNLPFVFKILVLPDITEVKEEQFEVHDGEAVAVYCQIILRTMISRPKGLENLMRAIRKINPLVIVVGEVEANHNSTSFVNRFTETLFYHGAFFDCLEACMSRDDAHRAILEGVHFADGMQNIVVNEGDERINRSVYLNTWRLFFARFGMVEIEFSDSCVYQANLVLQWFPCASSCTLEKNGKCLIVGWKGTPLHSLSTWKFV
ncbi:DELLA protein RGL1-like [Bidens hawaiensis]|uniref:DELLA protein RGL1-like n=1 Tax=Bidens hawaiensis TaxID=980011 RepID=UPI00404A9A6B